jgi:hypothetical protein
MDIGENHYESGPNEPVNINVDTSPPPNANLTNGKTKLDSQRIIRKGI